MPWCVSQAPGKPEVVVRPSSPSPLASTADEDKNLLKPTEGTDLWHLLPVCIDKLCDNL